VNGFFFVSKKHPHLRMNKWGVVFAPNGHPDGADYFGKSFEYVWLRQGLLDLQYEIEEEARAEGYTHKYVGGEKLYSKPTKERAHDRV